MRISDWSSDVCSSDLRDPIWLAALPRRCARRLKTIGIVEIVTLGQSSPRISRNRLGSRSVGRNKRAIAPGLVDRKSVVSGKGGSGSVDRWGRRIIKNKQSRKSTIVKENIKKKV